MKSRGQKTAPRGTPGATGEGLIYDLSWLEPAGSCEVWGSSAEESLFRRVACGVAPAGVIRGRGHFFMNGEMGILHSDVLLLQFENGGK